MRFILLFITFSSALLVSHAEEQVFIHPVNRLQIEQGDVVANPATFQRFVTVDRQRAFTQAKGVLYEGTGWQQQQVINAMAALAAQDDHEAVALLRKAVTQPESLTTRLRAAASLWKLGQRDVLSDVIFMWRQTGWNAERTTGFHFLIDFLVHSGDPDALLALGADIRQRNLEQRCDIALSLARTHSPLFTQPLLIPEQAERNIKFVLSELLMDDGIRQGLRVSIGPHSLIDPPIGEIAALALEQRFGLAYVPDRSAGYTQARQARAHLRNRVRAELQLPALPVPQAWQPTFIPSEAVHSFARSATSAARLIQLASLEQMGPGIVPGLRELRQQDPNLFNYLHGQDLLARIARSVNRVRIYGDRSAAPRVATLVEELDGNELRPRHLLDALQAYVHNKHPQAGLLRLRVVGEGDGLGLHLALHIEGTPGKRNYIRFRQQARINGAIITAAFGSENSADTYMDPSAQRRHIIEQAAFQPVELQLSYERR